MASYFARRAGLWRRGALRRAPQIGVAGAGTQYARVALLSPFTACSAAHDGAAAGSNTDAASQWRTQPHFPYREWQERTAALKREIELRDWEADVDGVLALHERIRALKTEVQAVNEERNAIAKQLQQQFGKKKKGKDKAVGDGASGGDGDDGDNVSITRESIAALQARGAEAKQRASALDAELSAAESDVSGMAMRVPNFSAPDTPLKILEVVGVGNVDVRVASSDTGDGVAVVRGDTPATMLAGERIAADTARAARENGDGDGDGGVATAAIAADGCTSGWELATRHRMVVDGSRVSGRRYIYLTNVGMLLERALVDYAVQTLYHSGFAMHSCPEVVRQSVAVACGFMSRRNPATAPADATTVHTLEHERHSLHHHMLPQTYGVTHPSDYVSGTGTGAEDTMCLAGTSEITLAGLHMDSIVDEGLFAAGDGDGDGEGALSLGGVSNCFRAEGGSGRWSGGLYRLHQFTKVEMFCLTLPCVATSQRSLHRLVSVQRYIMDGLGLRYRILRMPYDELAAPAFAKYDIEAYLPSEREWGEVTSASNCTDFQSRRLNIRVRVPLVAEDGAAVRDKRGNVRYTNEYVHTVNGTALAVPRTMLAILEQFQLPSGDVALPPVLRPYLHIPGDTRDAATGRYTGTVLIRDGRLHVVHDR